MMAQVWGSLYLLCGRPGWSFGLLTLAWYSPGSCGHLGNKWKISLSFHLCCSVFKIINKQININKTVTFHWIVAAASYPPHKSILQQPLVIPLKFQSDSCLNSSVTPLAMEVKVWTYLIMNSVLSLSSPVAIGIR